MALSAIVRNSRISLTVLRTKVFFTRNILINSDTLLVIAAGHLFELNRCKLSRSFCQMSCTKFPALPGSLSIFVMLPFFYSPTKPLLAFIEFFNGFGELKKLLDHLRSKLASITQTKGLVFWATKIGLGNCFWDFADPHVQWHLTIAYCRVRFLHIVHRRDNPPTFSAFGLNLTCGNYCLEHATFCSFLSTSKCHLECARSWECSLVLFASRARQDQPSLGEQVVFLKVTSPPLHLDGERGGGKRTATRRLGGNFWRPTSPSPHIVFPSIASRLSLTFQQSQGRNLLF